MKGRKWMLVYAGCLAIVLAALYWVSAAALKLERDWVEARADADRQESLRLALWRMDSWLVPLLAAEAARPALAYEPFYQQTAVVSKKGEPRVPEPVLAPSPLLSYQSEYFRLHFQYGADGRITSPQVPQGEYRELAEGGYLSAERINYNDSVLVGIEQNLSLDTVASCVAAAEGAAPAVPLVTAQQEQAFEDPQLLNIAQQARNVSELSRRQGAYRASQSLQAASAGAFVGFWSGGDLVFSRLVRLGDQEIYQGILCDWPKLRAALLAQIGDLFPHADLVPVRSPAAGPRAMMLATMPVSLVAGEAAMSAGAVLGPLRMTLGLAWAAVLAGAAAVAATLRSTIHFAQKRARFASAVTHELRTPLTTFRLYAEMLAEGMVQEPGQRAQYLETLRDESGRLSRLVENVLAYARLEEGRWRAAPRETTLGALMDHVVPALARRAAGSSMELCLESDGDRGAILRVDPEVVGQVLFNLVDNACKYAAEGSDSRIHLSAQVADGQVRLSVRDHGPGVGAERRRSIFRPFERGGDTVHSIPGVGLGLALSRGLAADMGGRLDLDEPAAGECGASFTLTLPLRGSGAGAPGPSRTP